MAILGDFVGTWAGTNGFRLMPADPLAEAPATAVVAVAAGGHLTTVSYTWRHPVDGPQEGMIVIGGDDSLTALLADSWHQKPEPMTLTGRAAPVTLEASYGGGWGWRIVLEGDAGQALRMRMENVLPPERATPDMSAYPAMVMELRPVL